MASQDPARRDAPKNSVPARIESTHTWPTIPPQFAFDRAAPRIIRSNDRLPAEVQEAFRHTWDGVVHEVGDYFNHHSYRDARKPKNLRMLLKRLEGLLAQAQELMIVCGTYWPMPGTPTGTAIVATGG